MVILQSINVGFRTAILVFTCFFTAVLNVSYKIKSCRLSNDFLFSCCFHVFFFVPRVDVNRIGAGGWVVGRVQVSNIESMLDVAK